MNMNGTTNEPITKECRRCHKTKPGSDFGRNPIMPDGLQAVCRACQAEQARCQHRNGTMSRRQPLTATRYELVRVLDTQYEVQGIECSNGEIRFKPREVCEILGVKWARQLQKTRANSTLNDAVHMMYTANNSRSGSAQTVTLPLHLLPAFVYAIDPRKVKPEARPFIAWFRDQCVQAMYERFKPALQNEQMAMDTLEQAVQAPQVQAHEPPRHRATVNISRTKKLHKQLGRALEQYEQSRESIRTILSELGGEWS